ncbi:MAG: hypothetical protein Q8N18_03460 [Opitutaceae bacterium]|nr:hypothetical protein [Opitutaceae bacterium]
MSPSSAKPAPSEVQVDQILAQYRSAPNTVRQDVRKGCLLYFMLALAIVAACVTIFYFTIGTR